MAVVSGIVSTALTKIGVIEIGGAVPAAFSALALEDLNAVLQEWAVEGLKLHALTAYAPITLVIGTATYTIGASGAVNVRRPVEIIAGVLTVQTGLFTDLTVYNELSRYRQYTSHPNGLPQEVYYDPTYPLGVLTFFPTPDKAYSVTLAAAVSQAPYAIGDTLLLPPEYESVLPLAVAVRLMPAFGKKDALLVSQADKAMSALATNNSKRLIREATFDSALVTRGSGGNLNSILTGG